MKKEILSLGLLIIVAVGLYVFTKGITSSSEAMQTFTIANESISVRVADSTLERVQGLSNTDFLPEGEGLLFVFEEPGQHGFWMKDMKFSIDILWFDESKTLIGAEKDISPDTFPETFHPKRSILYALETNVGEFSNIDDLIGQTFELSTEKSAN